ncbi:DUF2000 domain-containing protein [Nocardia tengchongensis]|uniref:DUF2000 domain-containing protein n=1 Tax=Nocardia tengchongensis TaxID=2055889 RepID=UPI00368E7AD5
MNENSGTTTSGVAATNSKCVVVVSDDLPVGLQVNAASVITMTLGERVPGLIGPDVKDGDGVLHPGIVLIPVPILTATADAVREMWIGAGENGLVRVGFSALAQSCRTYDEYEDRMASTATGELRFAGVGLYGAKKLVNRLAGSLPLLR